MNIEISINISCFNRKDMLKECVNSFLTQTFDNYEIVIVDDGSTDDLSFVSTMDERIKYFRQEHGGMAKGLNLALEKSIGKFVIPFGSDDLALPNLLQETYDMIQSNPEYDVIYTDCFIQNFEGGMIRLKHPEYLDEKVAYQKMLQKQYISHGGSLWKKEKIPQYDETVGSAEDLELFLTAMENGVKFKRLDKRLWVYRIGHVREGGSKSQNEGADKVLRRRGYRFDPIKRIGIKI